MAPNKATAAVLVLKDLLTDSLVLTKRSLLLRQHPGEICFPGGFQEADDRDLYATALRETEEELGIATDRIQLIRAMGKVQTVAGSMIQPWFASIESIHPYQLNPDEVSALILIPMRLVSNAKNYQMRNVVKEGYRFQTLEFVPNEEWVWGATARIMLQLCHDIYR
jgi:8-oxo-dGTP pyrophosphatase MutT (NUDIX family)